MISSASFTRQMDVPLARLASVSHFQGAAWARSPVDGAEWFFQLQAQPTGKGDVEDLYIHRYALAGGALLFRDTMVGLGFGHCQTVKARISAADNPHLWLGLETYDKAGTTVGTKPFKVRYRAGQMKRSDPFVVPIYVQSSWVAPIDCPDWTVVLRRTTGSSEVYEWFSEDDAVRAKAGAPAKVRKRVPLPRVASYQGACATGPYGAPDSIYRISGAAADAPQWLTQFRVSGLPVAQLDMTNIVSGSGGGTVEEPEAVLRIGDDLWVGKQTSPHTKSRVLAYRLLSPGQGRP